VKNRVNSASPSRDIVNKSSGGIAMSKVLSVIAAIALAAASLSAQGSIAGDWDLSINAPEGVMNATASLKQDGENVTGSITSAQGTVELKGTYKAKKVELAFQVQTPNGPLDIKVNGDVDGADMKGIIDFGMGMADFTAKKK
jgi:hypothetical protein